MVKPLRYFTFLLATILFLVSCQKPDDNDVNSSGNNLSVEAYVYVDEPVNYIKLSKMSGQSLLSPSPIVSAEIELWQDNQMFDFQEVDSLPGTYSQSNDTIAVGSNSPIYLNITTEEKTYRLLANIPPKIENLSIDETEITLDSNYPENVVATLTWEAIEGYDYCIFVRNVGNDYFPIPDPQGTHNESVLYQLITDSRIQLKCSDFTYQGHYDIYVTAVEKVYANFYNNPGNIAQLTELNSGLPTWGVFTVFNGSSVHVHVN